MYKNDINVLVVEDDAMVAEIIEGFLERLGQSHVVAKCLTLSKAKEQLESSEIDLVLLDLYLPDGNGMDLLKWIRLNDIDVDVILITADKKIKSIKEARKYGVKDYLVKPFKYMRFEEAIVSYRAELLALRGLDSVDQGTIDALMHNKEDAVHDGMNKTYDSILMFLKEHHPKAYTSSEVAEALGISRITARRYLENMEHLKEITLELDYGNVGRPKNKFSYIKKWDYKA